MILLVMCKIYTDVGGIKWIYHICPPVRKIIHSLKLVDYFHVQADNQWYSYSLAAFKRVALPDCTLGADGVLKMRVGESQICCSHVLFCSYKWTWPMPFTVSP